MTREEAERTLQEFYDFNKTLTPQGDSWLQADITINRETQRNLAEALLLAIEAMSRLLTDPETGLMPCGCGGVPVPYSWDETLFSGDTPCLDVTVACQKCGMGGNIWHESKLDAKNWWNTAMGWKVEE